MKMLEELMPAAIAGAAAGAVLCGWTGALIGAALNVYLRYHALTRPQKTA